MIIKTTSTEIITALLLLLMERQSTKNYSPAAA